MAHDPPYTKPQPSHAHSIYNPNPCIRLFVFSNISPLKFSAEPLEFSAPTPCKFSTRPQNLAALSRNSIEREHDARKLIALYRFELYRIAIIGLLISSKNGLAIAALTALTVGSIEGGCLACKWECMRGFCMWWVTCYSPGGGRPAVRKVRLFGFGDAPILFRKYPISCLFLTRTGVLRFTV